MNASEPEPNSAPVPATRRRLPLRAAAVLAARVRFVLLVGALLGLIAAWPLLQNLWAKLTRPAPAGGAVSPDTEYWCPMCPGVVSEWPSKCPVCNMTLVRRRRGESVPLPRGVLARMQLSPHRVPLAGLTTPPVPHPPLARQTRPPGGAGGR